MYFRFTNRLFRIALNTDHVHKKNAKNVFFRFTEGHIMLATFKIIYLQPNVKDPQHFEH